MAISKFTITAASLFFAFSLPACSNESETSSKQENAKVSEQAQAAAWLDDSLIVCSVLDQTKASMSMLKVAVLTLS